MKRLTIIIFVAFLTACGGGSSGGGGQGLIGFWAGTTSSSVVNFTSPMSLNITNDDGVNISGAMQVNNSPCFRNATFAGSRTGGANLNAGTTNGNNVLSATLVQNGNTLSGNYVVQSGACAGDRGVMSVSR
ncbi:hypothetical protein ACFL17_07165 [Pseudomonadota bacterium]